MTRMNKETKQMYDYIKFQGSMYGPIYSHYAENQSRYDEETSGKKISRISEYILNDIQGMVPKSIEYGSVLYLYLRDKLDKVNCDQLAEKLYEEFIKI